MPWPTFKSQAEIPEAFRSEYEEKEGAWHPKLPDTSKLDETLTKVRTEKKDAEKAAKAAEDRAADLQRQLDAKSATGVDTDKKIGELLQKWEQDKNAAVQKVQAQLDQANGKLRDVTLYDKAKQAFIDAGGRPEKADAALKLKKDVLDLADDRMVVKNEKGEVTTTTVSDFWSKEFRKEMPEFFAGTKASGGGATGGASTVPATGAGNAAERVIANPLAMLQEANAAAT